MADTDETTLSYNTADYAKKSAKPKKRVLEINGHSFRLIDKLDSYQTMVERDIALEDLIHEDDLDRFLETWEENRDEWDIEAMSEIARDLGKKYAPNQRKNRKSRRSKR
jgi:hypothetical protein